MIEAINAYQQFQVYREPRFLKLDGDHLVDLNNIQTLSVKPLRGEGVWVLEISYFQGNVVLLEFGNTKAVREAYNKIVQALGI